MKEAWKGWASNVMLSVNLKSLPLIINWGIWLARNNTIFLGKSIVPEGGSCSRDGYFGPLPTV
jgi:hypothetical protein